MSKLTFFLAMLYGVTSGNVHDGVNDDWYESLKVPGTGASCCNKADCAPTDQWRITGTAYEVVIRGIWTPVPPEKLILNRGNPTGRAVLCQNSTGILCFVPGTTA